MATSMQDIEKLAANLAAARDALTNTAAECEVEVAEVRKPYAKEIRRQARDLRQAWEKLVGAVGESKALFVKPKSTVLHAIKLGYRKGKGKIDWDIGDDLLLKRIRKNHPDMAELLIETVETPVKTALANLPASDLKALGVTVEDTGDVAFVTLADTEVAKLVKGLLKGAATEEAAA